MTALGVRSRWATNSAVGESNRNVTWADRFVWLALVSSALPAIFEMEWKLVFGFGSAYLSDVLLLVGVLVSVAFIRFTPAVSLLFFSALLATVVGWWNNAATNTLLADARGYLYLLAGMIIGVRIFLRPQCLGFGFKAITALISITAVLAIATQVTDAPIVGRESGVINAVYYNGKQTLLDANRIQSEPVHLALFAVCFLIAGWILNVNLKKVAGTGVLGILLVSSCVLTLLAFSRNSIFGIAVAAVLAILIPAQISRGQRMGRAVRGSVLTALVAGVPLWIGYQAGYFSAVFDTFSGRVLEGLSLDVVSNDPSVGWRFTETEAGVTYFLENPLVGSGFGAFYRGVLPGDPFQGNGGRGYLHNYFLMIFVKFGVLVGMLIVGVIIAGTRRLITSSRERLPLMAPLGCALAGLCVVSLVSPALYSRSFAAFAGCLIAWGLCSLPKKSTRLNRYPGESYGSV